MKIRPQLNLRFRDEGQLLEAKRLAGKEHLSVNEWVLRKIEYWVRKEVTNEVRAHTKDH
jgi:hypothetical protein